MFWSSGRKTAKLSCFVSYRSDDDNDNYDDDNDVDDDKRKLYMKFPNKEFQDISSEEGPYLPCGGLDDRKYKFITC